MSLVTQRFFDLMISILGLTIGFPFFIIIYVFAFFDTRSPLFWQRRLGSSGQYFMLVKFRTMKLDTVSVPTHLVDASRVTRFGRFLRKTKLDELPQLWNVLSGDMSVVGPRPCLPEQSDLILARRRKKIEDRKPGITGLSQLRGLDMSNPEALAMSDAEMMDGLSVGTYWKYVFFTVIGVGFGDKTRP